MRTTLTTILAGLLVIAMVVPAGANEAPPRDGSQEDSSWIVTLVDGAQPGRVGRGLARGVGGDSQRRPSEESRAESQCGLVDIEHARMERPGLPSACESMRRWQIPSEAV